MNHNFPNMFTPIQIGTVTVPNRFVVPPMGNNFANTDGSMSDRSAAYYEARAKGGFGLITIESTVVYKQAKGGPRKPCLFSDEVIPSFKAVADRCHAYGAKVSIQLQHAGPEGNSKLTGYPLKAASAIAPSAGREIPEAMPTEEVYKLIECYGDAARRAQLAGIDMVEVHCAHGYLVSTFISQRTNNRTDEFGGCFENRMRLPRLIIENIRKKTGGNLPILCRINACDEVPGGQSVQDAAAVAAYLEQECGVDALHVTRAVHLHDEFMWAPGITHGGFKSVYLDNASTSFPKPACVPEAVYRYMTACGSNVSRGGYQAAYSAEELVFETRQQLCALFHGEDARCVVFTPNITTSLNMLLKGFLHPGDHVLVSSMEHNAVMRPLRQLEAIGVRFDRIPCRADGTLVLDAMEDLLRENTKLVLCLHASNVCGTLLPIDAIGAFCHRHGLRFFLDSAQTAGVFPIDIQKSRIDAVAFTGHKSLLGPQGTGGIILREGLAETLTPLLAGGTGSMSHTEFMPDFLPDRLEPGTMNLPGLAGLHAALGFLQETGLDIVRAHELALTKHFLDGLAPMQAENRVKIIGLPDTQNRAGVVSIQPVQHDPAELAANLDERFGIATRVGLHCAPAAHQALGTFPTGTIRFSFGFFNTEADADYALSALDTLTKEALHGF